MCKGPTALTLETHLCWQVQSFRLRTFFTNSGYKHDHTNVWKIIRNKTNELSFFSQYSLLSKNTGDEKQTSSIFDDTKEQW